MADSFTPAQRSHIMSMIRGKDTKPELIVRRYLFLHGFRFRVNVRRLPGTPDIVLRKYRTAIFVNGCFWHSHEGCADYRPPRSRVEWWTEKLRRNKERDERVRAKLREMGWQTMVIWECQLKPQVREATLKEVVRLLQRRYVETHFQARFDAAPSYPSLEESAELSVAAEPDPDEKN